MASKTSTDSYSPLERLPLLVLEEICEYLSRMETRRHSLFAFSQVSKVCCDAAKRERFERILFSTEDEQQTDSAIARWRRILAVDHRTKLVRRVKIIGGLMSNNVGLDFGVRFPHHATTHRIRELEALDDAYGIENLVEEEPFLRLPVGDFPTYSGSQPECTEQNKAIANKLWRPVADFLSTLPGLKDLIWASTDQVPRCILDVLHESLPRTRLHVNTFSLRSLHQKPHRIHDIDPDEYALASSPNLYSVCAIGQTVDDDGHASYNEEALQRMMRGVAPNLRRVFIYVHHRHVNIEMHVLDGAGRPPWPGFFATKDVAQASKGCLERLVIDGVNRERLSQWAAHTDLSKLRTFGLLKDSEGADFEDLTDMAERAAFPNLDTLSIGVDLDKFTESEERDAFPHLDTLSIRLFYALPTLKRLFVQYPMARATTTATLTRHGPSLQKLQLSNISSLEEIREIQYACPNLRDLRIGLRRSSGDELEVAIYELLGSFPRLESLALNLHNTLDLPPEDRSDHEEVARRMCHELTNAAMDADLARAIFNIILTANSKTRPGAIPVFRNLKIEGVCRRFWNSEYVRTIDYIFSTLTRWVARSWLCERQRGGAEGGEVHVQEMGRGYWSRRRRPRLEYRIMQWAEKYRSGLLDGNLVMPAWCKVWPEAEGRIDWMLVWYSTPLALGT